MSLLDFLKKRNAESPLRYELRILFMYHDVLRTHVSFLYRWRIAASRRRMSRGIKRRQGKKPLDVAFLLSVPGMWKLHYVYEAMRCDERYHPYLVLMPYLMCKGYSSEEMLKTMTRTEEFVKAQGYEYVIPYDYTKKKWINIKKSYNPDIVFFTDPYKEMVPMYHAHYFRDTLTCYVPYAFTSMNLYKNNYDKLALCTCGCYFVETEMHKEFAEKYGHAAGRNVYVTGYAGCEVYMRDDYKVSDVWKVQEQKKKRLIWAPHHTIDGTFSVSTFLTFCDTMLELSEKYKNEVQFAFKPHQLLKFKLIDLWGEEKTNNYYTRWQEMNNGQLEEGVYTDLFIGSDAMIHDSGGFTTEYLYQNKPVLYLMKNSDPASMFNEFGVKAFNQHYKGKTQEDIERFIEDVVIAGNDPLKDSRERFYSEYLTPYNGELPSQNIMRVVSDAFDVR